MLSRWITLDTNPVSQSDGTSLASNYINQGNVALALSEIAPASSGLFSNSCLLNNSVHIMVIWAAGINAESVHLCRCNIASG